MTKTMLVCGYGGGVSDAVARRFGREGFQLALVARSADKLAAAAASFRGAGVRAEGFACDLGDLGAVRAMVANVRESLGPITVIHWNVISGLAGDLTTCELDDLRASLDVAVHSLVVTVQASLADLRAQQDAAILVTGGGFALNDPQVDGIIAKIGAMGLGLQKAAQHKLTGMLHAKLAPDGIYVGEVMILGAVKGTAFDRGNATLEASAIADRFWGAYLDRSEICVRVT